MTARASFSSPIPARSTPAASCLFRRETSAGTRWWMSTETHLSFARSGMPTTCTGNAGTASFAIFVEVRGRDPLP